MVSVTANTPVSKEPEKLPVADIDTEKAEPKIIMKEVRELVETLVVKVSRQELYDKIWEISVAGAAKEYGIPYPQLMKQVKAAQIPIPPSGYWTKITFGKPAQKTPLNEPTHTILSLYKTGKTINPHEVTVSPATHKTNKVAKKIVKKEPVPQLDDVEKTEVAAVPQQQIVTEALSFLTPEEKSVVMSVATQIILPDENSRMHTKITTHRKRVIEWHKESRKHDQYWNRQNKDATPFLADTISEAALPRVFRIFDALIKALEPLGCSLTDDLKFIVNGETVSLFISESQDKVDHVPTREENIRLLQYEEEKRKHSWASKPNIRKYDYVYNGKITLAVYSEKSFRDCKSYVIEDHMGDIFVLLYEASNTLRIQREAREAAEQKRKEEERQREARRERYNREVELTNALVNEAENYDTACKIRAYISAVEHKEHLTEEEIAWVAWAKQKADWYDPTIKRKDEFLGIRSHSEDSSHKKLEKSYSSWGW